MDRRGYLHLPFDQGMELAQSFCKVEPLSVLTPAMTTERSWSSEASRPGGEYVIPLLNSYRAGWAIVRQWCHNDAFIAAREKEIGTLVQLVWDAIYALQKAGADEEQLDCAMCWNMDEICPFITALAREFRLRIVLPDHVYGSSGSLCHGAAISAGAP